MLKEHRIATDEQGRPDLSCFTDPIEHYMGYYEDFLAFRKLKRVASQAEAREAWSKRVFAVWGFIANGTEALPYVLQMLKSPVADAREDAGGVLAELGRQESVVDPLIEAVEAEGDEVA